MSLSIMSNAAPLFTALALPLVMPLNAIGQSPTPFVPREFKVPEKLETKEFRLRMLTVNDVVKDYDAVMTSVEHLRTIWPGGSWPDGLTFEQDLIDLGWHQKEFQRRASFAYTVVTPSESKVMRASTSILRESAATTRWCFYGRGKASFKAGLSRDCSLRCETGWPRNGRSRK
jgi:hypothetical protein